MSSKPVKSRLGRGLSALLMPTEPLEIDVSQPPGAAGGMSGGNPALPATPAELPVEDIAANPYQPRKRWDDAGLASLAESLKASGLIQPVVVRRNDRSDGSASSPLYQLIAGERRLRAAKLAGFATIPVIVREADPAMQAQMALVENIQRADLNPLERAAAYQTLLLQLGLTQAQLAQRLGEDRSGIANHLRLLDLAEPVKQHLRDGRISLGHAKLLAGVADVLEQERLAKLTVEQDLSVRALEQAIQGEVIKPAVAVPPAPPAAAHYQELERSISHQLGLRVQLRQRGGKGKGSVVIHYGSLEQFDQLMGKLGIDLESA